MLKFWQTALGGDAQGGLLLAPVAGALYGMAFAGMLIAILSVFLFGKRAVWQLLYALLGVCAFVILVLWP